MVKNVGNEHKSPLQWTATATTATTARTQIMTERDGTCTIVWRSMMTRILPQQQKKIKPNRVGGGQAWFDPTLETWDPSE